MWVSWFFGLWTFCVDNYGLLLISWTLVFSYVPTVCPSCLPAAWPCSPALCYSHYCFHLCLVSIVPLVSAPSALCPIQCLQCFPSFFLSLPPHQLYLVSLISSYTCVFLVVPCQLVSYVCPVLVAVFSPSVMLLVFLPACLLLSSVFQVQSGNK